MLAGCSVAPSLTAIVDAKLQVGAGRPLWAVASRGWRHGGSRGVGLARQDGEAVGGAAYTRLRAEAGRVRNVEDVSVTPLRDARRRATGVARRFWGCRAPAFKRRPAVEARLVPSTRGWRLRRWGAAGVTKAPPHSPSLRGAPRTRTDPRRRAAARTLRTRARLRRWSAWRRHATRDRSLARRQRSRTPCTRS